MTITRSTIAGACDPIASGGALRYKANRLLARARDVGSRIKQSTNRFRRRMIMSIQNGRDSSKRFPRTFTHTTSLSFRNQGKSYSTAIALPQQIPMFSAYRVIRGVRDDGQIRFAWIKNRYKSGPVTTAASRAANVAAIKSIHVYLL